LALLLLSLEALAVVLALVAMVALEEVVVTELLSTTATLGVVPITQDKLLPLQVPVRLDKAITVVMVVEVEPVVPGVQLVGLVYTTP
jgi:hypothetical protein